MEFKVCVGTTDRFNQLRNRIYEKLLKAKPFRSVIMNFIKWNDEGITYSDISAEFNSWPEPELTFDQAMKLLDEIEPEPPFKFGDDVLVRDAGKWSWKKFVRYEAGKPYPFIADNGYYKQIAKLKGNEHLVMTDQTPDEYWLAENGKLEKVEK